MLMFAMAMWALNRWFPLLDIIPKNWNRLASLVMTSAAIPPVLAFFQFWRAHTTIDPFRPERATRLVTSGVYALTRNPMYLGLSMLLLGWAIDLGSLTPVVLAPLFIPLILHVQIRPEEHALLAQFGQDYARYCQRVNRWFGRRRLVAPWAAYGQPPRGRDVEGR
jgi:protein-S-isoprenylcysteine O-methyltransferase Ste14